MRLTPEQIEHAIAEWRAVRPSPTPFVVVTVTRVDRLARVMPSTAPPGGCYVGRIAALDPETIAAELDGATVQLERLFCDLGVLEPQGEELVIVALAPGVSAVELQALVGPALKITHEVAEMIIDGTDHGLAG